MSNDPVVGKLKPDQLKEITAGFKQFDVNGNGSITPDEMKECLRQSNIPHNDVDVAEVMLSMDTNQDGSVSFDEYLKFMARVYMGPVEQPQQKPPTKPNPRNKKK